MKDYFEKLYEGVACKWGLKPDFILVHFLDLFLKGKILDLGMGEGRNALFLAERGFNIEGIDLSKTAIERCLQLAKDRNIDIEAHVGDFRDFRIPTNRYSLIMSTGASLNFLKRNEIETIIDRMRKGVVKGGFIYVSVISTSDPQCEKSKSQQTPVEESTFFVHRIRAYVHYFSYEEIKKLFSGFQTIIHLEGLELDFHDRPHYHGMIYYLGKKS